MAVADAGNNRILLWADSPRGDFASADVILGQRDSRAVDHNRGAYWPDAAAVNMPYGIAAVGDVLVAADTANSRLLGWSRGDLATGAAATRVHGQPDFAAKGDNRWLPPVADSLCWPYGVTGCGDLCVVADSGNNRVQLWRLRS